jgi:prophage antirepressor-like protein
MNETDGNPSTKVALFQKRAIRRAMHNNEWWFVIVDVVAVLTNSPNPSGYLRATPRSGSTNGCAASPYART